MANVNSITPCLLLILLSVFAPVSQAVRRIPVQPVVADGAQQSTLVTPPSNDAAYVGETVILECRVDQPPPTSWIMWGEYITNSGGNVISDNDVILDHPNKDRYRIIHISPIQFDLEISDVQLSDGGRYVCQNMNSGPPNQYRGMAELVILEAAPNCTTTAPADGRVIEGQSYTVECIIHYQGQWAPTMTWTGPPPFQVGDSPPNPTTVWSGVQYTVDRTMDTRAFECLTNFTDIGNVPGETAGNTPDWSHLHRANQIFVFWGPMNLQVDPVKPEYAIGDVINCSCDAKPAANFTWQNMDSLVLTQGNLFTVTPDMVGKTTPLRCQAQNSINGFVYSENLFIYPYVPPPTTVPTTGPTTPTTTLPAFGNCRDLTGRWLASNPYAEMVLEVVPHENTGQIKGIMMNHTDTVWVEVVGTYSRGDHIYLGLSAIWPFNDGVTGMAAECHSCAGREMILAENLWRAKENSAGCGIGSIAAPDVAYNFTRVGTSAILREREFDVYRPTEEISGQLGIKLKKRR